MVTIQPSFKPYMLRAVYDWCADAGQTPHIVVIVDHNTHVPNSNVVDGQITLNISSRAVHGLVIGSELVQFTATFSGIPHDIIVPVDRVAKIFAIETGHGAIFGVDNSLPPSPPELPATPKQQKPKLKIVK